MLTASLIKSAEAVKYLGVYMDKNLNFKKQITEKCKVASMNPYRIKDIRQYLTLDACKVLVLGLVIVHLDYANSIYSGLPKKGHTKTTENPKSWSESDPREK